MARITKAARDMNELESRIVDRHQHIAYIRSRGWTRYEPDDITPGGSWIRPGGKGAQRPLDLAVEEQRATEAAEDPEPITLEQALANAVQWAKSAGTLALEQRRDVMAQIISVAASALKNALAKVQRQETILGPAKNVPQSTVPEDYMDGDDGPWRGV